MKKWLVLIALVGILCYSCVESQTLPEYALLLAQIFKIIIIPFLPPNLELLGFQIVDISDVDSVDVTLFLGSNVTCQNCSYFCEIPVDVNFTGEATYRWKDLLSFEDLMTEVQGLSNLRERTPESDPFPPSLSFGNITCDLVGQCSVYQGCIPPFDPCAPAPFDCSERPGLKCCLSKSIECVKTCIHDCSSEVYSCIEKCARRVLDCEYSYSEADKVM